MSHEATKQWFEQVFDQIDLQELLFELGMQLRDEYYGFIPIQTRVRYEYTGPERQLTVGTQPRTGR